MRSRGEIYHAGQILRPDAASEFGSVLIGLTTSTVDIEFIGQIHHGSETLLFGNSHLFLSPLHSGLLKESAKFLHEKYPVPDTIFENPFATIILGRKIFGDWHRDPRIYRMLVNLSSDPVKLWVADKIPNAEEIEFIVPTNQRFIEYGPGEAVILDNLCETLERVPHTGGNEPGKDILRLDASAKQ